MLERFTGMFKGGKFSGPIEQVRLGTEVAAPGASIVTDKEGNITSDTTAVPTNILDQLKSPAAREMIKQQRRIARNGPPVMLPKPRMLQEGTQRNYTSMKPAGMPSSEFRKLRRSQFHQLTKDAIAEQRRIRYALSTANNAPAGN